MADVGTDHGWLPLYLLQCGRAESAVATDIREGPLSRAVSHAEEYDLPLRCVLCDGLSALSQNDADTVIVAGMGGENIVSILSAAPWVQEHTRLLLQPMSRSEALRAAMPALGLRILSETLIEDAGRLYTVIEAEGGAAEELSPAEMYVGKQSLLADDPLRSRQLKEAAARLRKIEKGLRSAEEDTERTRLSALRVILEDLVRIGGKEYA